MEADDQRDVETIGAEVTDAARLLEPMEGTFLPAIVVRAQLELAELSDVEIAKRLADLVVAVALRRGIAMTPKKLLAEMLETYKISDESWREKTAPELRRVLRANGHEFPVG